MIHVGHRGGKPPPAGSPQAGSQPRPAKTEATTDGADTQATEGRTATREGVCPELTPEADSPSSK